MPTIVINVTAEELKAVEAFEPSATVSMQGVWDLKSTKSLEKVMILDSDLNVHKMSKQEQSDWVKDNPGLANPGNPNP